MPQSTTKGALALKHLFVDDRFIEQMSGLTRRFHEPLKCAQNPVIRADRPWEHNSAAFVDTGLVVYDQKDQLFKAWYQGGYCFGPGDLSNMCYATSSDGINWDKPSLGVVEFEGSKDNNIVLMAPCMMHDPAPIIDYKDPNPERRFKAVWWGGRKDPSAKDGWLLGHCVAFSPDGFHWTEHPDNPVWPGDAEVATPFGIERRSGKLVAYSSADGYGTRVVARSESENFVDWDLPPKLVFRPDDADPPGTEMSGLAAIDYDCTAIGMLWVIRNLPGFTKKEWQEIVDRNIRQGSLGPPISMNAAACRIMYTELVSSIDGVEWQRICRRPFLPLGPQASWDECISLVARPIVANDRIYLYYTGHGRTMQTPGVEKLQPIRDWTSDTGLATLRLDGFASLQAQSTPGGILLTRSFDLEGTTLAVNVDASNGVARIEVVDENCQPIPGFTKEQAQPITTDQLRATAKWASKSDVGELRGQRIKLRIFLENAHLYSISILDAA